jgi:hypothetical protein
MLDNAVLDAGLENLLPKIPKMNIEELQYYLLILSSEVCQYYKKHLEAYNAIEKVLHMKKAEIGA